MSHFPRKPVRFIEANDELLDIQKAVASDMRTSTDYGGPTETAYPAQSEPQYRTPHDRVSGNEMFRRYPDGSLDYAYAKDKVVEAVHKVRDGGVLTSVERVALSCMFPHMFSGVDSGVSAAVRAVNLRLSAEESMKVALLVAKHLSQEMSFMHSSHAR